MIFSGKDKDSERMEILEIPSHPFFFATQFHPEYKTYPFNPTPAFYSFVLCSSKQYDKFKQFSKERKTGVHYLEDEKEVTKLIEENSKDIKETKRRKEMILEVKANWEKVTEALNERKNNDKELKDIISSINVDEIDEKIEVDSKITLKELLKLLKNKE